MKDKRGFTLLEMLVVVLIIGILAGIAFPQYRNAVRKARVAEAKITLRALVDATDRYILEHGNSSWGSLDNLDTEVQTNLNNWRINIDECVSSYDGTLGCVAVAEPKWESDYLLYFWSTNYEGGINEYCGKFECCANNDNGKKICQSLGGKAEENDDSCFIL